MLRVIGYMLGLGSVLGGLMGTKELKELKILS